MATLKEFRDQITIDAGVSGNPLFPILRLNKMINLAQRYVQTNLNGLGMKKWETSDTLTLADGLFGGVTVLKSNLSTDCPNMLESPNSIIFIDTEGSGASSIAYEVDRKNFQEQLLNPYLTSTESKPIFMRLANFIWLMPSTISDAIAYYYKAVADLSSDSASTEIPLEFEELVIKKVVLEIEAILGKIQDKVLATQQLEKDIQATYEKYIGKQAQVGAVKTTEKARLE